MPMPRPPSRRTRRLALATAGSLLTASALAGPGLGTSAAGGHVDAPGVIADPQANITDVYAFTSPDDPAMVTVIADVQPFQLPAGTATPLNYPFAAGGARYEIHVDSHGTGRPDLTYRWTFRTEDRRLFGAGPIATGRVRSLTDPALRFRQTYTLERIRAGRAPQTLVKDAPVAPTRQSAAVMPDYGALRGQATTALPGGGRALATQAAESFQADARVFGYFIAGTAGPVPGYLPAANPLAAINVSSLILQVPKSEVALNGDAARNPVVGVWATVSRPGADLAGDLRTQEATYRQVGRLGNPHIGFALWGSFGATAKPGGPEDRFNARPAEQDHNDRDFLASALDPAPPHKIEAAGGRRAPAGPRTDIRALFLSGIGKDNGAKFGFDLNTQAMNADADPNSLAWADELRLNLTTPVTAAPDRLGVLAGDLQGYPNGRRPNDMIDNSLLRMLEGEPGGPSAAGLLPKPLFDVQPKPASDVFPYLNLPHALP
ncbi:hypothetical protein ADL22_09175 [Streptomyces sp. NRRL F-4489]|uniref:DUF4331 domain-containing protein n=1 Tax=Streptomyces sp. NRRL F-4489 TaxID=1609095 RepID=UPI00074AF5CF|nr:DUF4331 domain-containing protein [Streptomyces sp. NRRL F-4489]KUL48746.1 hypothetical protein ADL22_09175 [Streptomyces sp. NRRL F-4489]